MSVTPRGMLSSLQPESACAAAAAVAASTAGAREASFARIIITGMPYSARLLLNFAGHATPNTAKSPCASLRQSSASGPIRRLVDATDQPLQAQRQSASFLLREEAPQLALAAVRLDRQPARVQACRGAAQFNLRPMPREHDP